MAYQEFIKPYADGYEDGEIGNTPVTAEILNTNYDGFLLALNEFLPELEGKVEANPSESATAGNLTKLKVGNSIYLIPSGGGSGSSVSFQQILSSGTKIGIITIDGNAIDVFAPTPSGGASAYSDLSDVTVSSPSTGQVPIYNATSEKWENGTLSVGDDVSFTQVVSMGTKLGTITINNVDYDIYAPAQTNPALSDLTDTAISNPADGQVLKYNSTTEKWENGNESGGSGGHTILNDSGTSLSQEDDLQFKGTYVHDDSTNGKTVVEMSRQMTRAQFNLLSEAEKKGLIQLIDEEEADVMFVGGVYIDTDNVVKDDFTIDGTARDWIATEDCIVFGLLQATDQYTSAYFNIDGESTFVTLNATTGETAYIPVKKGQTLTYRSTSGTYTRMKAYGVQTGTKTLPWTELTSTLTAGNTSLVISDTSITTDSVIDYYTDTFGVEPTNIVVTTGSITLTFDAQQSDVGVKVRVS